VQKTRIGEIRLLEPKSRWKFLLSMGHVFVFGASRLLVWQQKEHLADQARKKTLSSKNAAWLSV